MYQHIDLDLDLGPAAPARPTDRPSFVVLSTYPPTPCGVATFSAALCGGLAAGGADVRVVRVGDGPVDPAGADPTVVASLPDDGRPPPAAALDALASADVVIVQHEYGIYAGHDGDSLVALLAGLDTPTVVVAHTVLAAPTDHQRSVLEAVVASAGAVVVMTEAGRRRLISGYEVDPRKVFLIPHGAAVAPLVDRPPPPPATLLTWGLLGPGKGIEWAIDALAQLDDLRPRVQYCIAGATHPKVVAADGEAYRHMLQGRAGAAGLASRVQFDPAYRDVPALGELISQAALVVLPYDSPDQVTSGVLVDAIAAGRPVVATAFPHAEELLASGAGLVVPRHDPGALAAALRRALTEPGLLERMAAEARRLAPGLAWPAVAAQHEALGTSLLRRRPAVVA